MGKQRARLLWRCRRGIKEMDLLLEAFINEQFDSLSFDQKRQFSMLLEEADLDIIAWISGTKKPVQKGYRDVVQLLRKTAGTL